MHYLNQCWLIINEILWHSPEDDFSITSQDIYPWYECENHTLKTISTSSNGQIVNLSVKGTPVVHKSDYRIFPWIWIPKWNETLCTNPIYMEMNSHLMVCCLRSLSKPITDESRYNQRCVVRGIALSSLLSCRLPANLNSRGSSVAPTWAHLCWPGSRSVHGSIHSCAIGRPPFARRGHPKYCLGCLAWSRRPPSVNES